MTADLKCKRRGYEENHRKHCPVCSNKLATKTEYRRSSELAASAGWVRLTVTEKDHLVSLLNENEREGWYYGPREQYEKRAKRIKAKLEGAPI